MKSKRGILFFRKNICVSGFASVVGQREGKGPLKEYFDLILKGHMFLEKTYERAESKLQKIAVIKSMQKANLTGDEIDAIFGGDLLNQCIGTSYGVKELKIPLVGLYGACSTLAESILVAASFIESEFFERTISVTSSHFCAAERQFRFPIEYGSQRNKTSQWTVTGAGSVLLEEGNKNDEKIFVRAGVIGKIVDFGIKDINNMGAAMAPAAADTILRFFEVTNSSYVDYDLILTGDLGAVGTIAFLEILKRKGIELGKKHEDCGLLIYDEKDREIESGGSGAGCCASVLTSYVLNRMKEKEIKRVIFIATGALMSKTSNQQGETIPSIAHLVFFEGED